MTEAASDKKQIGLTEAGDGALTLLMETGWFASESDAYKVAVAYALAKSLEIDDAPEKGYTTKFNAAGGLDRYGDVRDVISVVRPQDRSRPYVAAERLAELGLTELSRRVAAHESLADILAEFAVHEESNGGASDGFDQDALDATAPESRP